MGVMVVLGAVTLERHASQVGRGRRYVRGILESGGVDADNAVLIASELLTNAVDHGRGPNMSLLLASDKECIRLEVSDGGAPTIPAVQHPDEASEHGRGLGIVAALADCWGTTKTLGRTTVWAALPH